MLAQEARLSVGSVLWEQSQMPPKLSCNLHTLLGTKEPVSEVWAGELRLRPPAPACLAAFPLNSLHYCRACSPSPQRQALLVLIAVHDNMTQPKNDKGIGQFSIDIIPDLTVPNFISREMFISLMELSSLFNFLFLSLQFRIKSQAP